MLAVPTDTQSPRCAADSPASTDTQRDPELFWALRGAGGGQFGVVNSLVFATVAEPHATRFELHWTDGAAAAVIAAWQQWAPIAPDDITANLTVIAEPGRPLRVVVFGAVLRDGDATLTLLDQLIAAVGTRPGTRACEGLTFCDLKRALVTLDQREDSARVTTLPVRAFRLPAPGRRDRSAARCVDR